MLRVDSVQNLRPDRKLIRRILVIGIPNAIENGMFQIGKLSVSSLTSTLGTAAIAANAVANNTTTLLNIPANAVGMGALTVLGQCLGAGDKKQAKRYGGPDDGPGLRRRLGDEPGGLLRRQPVHAAVLQPLPPRPPAWRWR